MPLPHTRRLWSKARHSRQANMKITTMIAGTAPVGLHKTLYCRVSLPWQGPGGQRATVVHRLGQGGQLRILEAANSAGQKEQPQQ